MQQLVACTCVLGKTGENHWCLIIVFRKGHLLNINFTMLVVLFLENELYLMHLVLGLT